MRSDKNHIRSYRTIWNHAKTKQKCTLPPPDPFKIARFWSHVGAKLGPSYARLAPSWSRRASRRIFGQCKGLFFRRFWSALLSVFDIFLDSRKLDSSTLAEANISFFSISWFSDKRRCLIIPKALEVGSKFLRVGGVEDILVSRWANLGPRSVNIGPRSANVRSRQANMGRASSEVRFAVLVAGWWPMNS